jgi:TetR/AcrR family transcriptional regulator, transcriptional repressor for nem operon
MARPREFDETEVLTAARNQFWSTGYAGTSIDTIASVTGLGKGSLYGAFGDKHKLFVRVFDDYCAAVTGAAGRELAGPDEGALARLQSYVRTSAVSTAADVELRGCLLAKGTAELAEHDQEIARRAREAFESLENTLTATIEAGQRRRDIDPAADARQLAQLILALMRGIEALGKAGKESEALRSIAESALATIPRGPRLA